MQLYAYMHPMESIMHLRTALPLLALVGSLSACTVLPPLPPEPNYGYHPHPAPAVIYVPQPAVVQVYERPQLHRVYPLMRDRDAPRGREYYEDQYGQRWAVDPERARHEHHWPR